MEILGKILGNPARVKIMRLFLSNKESSFSSQDIIKRSRVNAVLVRSELRLLNAVGFIKKHGQAWFFDFSFKYGVEFENLLVRSESLSNEAILNHFKKVGKIKLFIVAGVFIKNKDSRVDLLIVGDKLNKSKIEKGIKNIEAEVGIELVYAMFETKEFDYRLNMYDKLVRDILDFPHEIVWQAKELNIKVARHL